MSEVRRRYIVSGAVLFAMSILVLVARIGTGYLSTALSGRGLEPHIEDLALDAFFTVIVQVLILFIMPLLVYMLALRLTPREVFRFSNFRKTRKINYLLAVCIGIAGIFVTIGISLIWQVILIIFGYMPPQTSTAMAPSFNFGLFLASFVLTAILPGFCEEFTMRGGFLTSVKSALPFTTVIVVSGLAFGLFHQFILQTFYTACFGALMAFITLRTKSIFPAMIVHCVNNGLSVYMDYSSTYNLPGGGLMTKILEAMINGYFGVVALMYFAVVGIFALLVYLLVKYNPKDVTLPVMANGNPPILGLKLLRSARKNSALGGFVRPTNGFANNPTHTYPAHPSNNPANAAAGAAGAAAGSGGRPTLGGLGDMVVRRSPPLELDPKLPARFLPVVEGLDQSQIDEGVILFVNYRYYLLKGKFLYALREKPKFTPALRDNILYFGAIAVAAASTLSSLIWGFIV